MINNNSIIIQHQETEIANHCEDTDTIGDVEDVTVADEFTSESENDAIFESFIPLGK